MNVNEKIKKSAAVEVTERITRFDLMALNEIKRCRLMTTLKII